MLLWRLASLSAMILVLTSFVSAVDAKGVVPDAHPSIPVDRFELIAPGDPFPQDGWPVRPVAPFVDFVRFARAADGAFISSDETRALLVIHHGAIVYERYAPGFGRDSRFPSGAIAASVTGAAIGILVHDGKLTLDQAAPIDVWRGKGDSRARITVKHLLTMTSGLAWSDRSPLGSDERAMLYGRGRADMAAFAESKPLRFPPGSSFRFSSGDTIILDNLIGRTVAPHANGDEEREAVTGFFDARLFKPLGIRSAVMEFDPAGTFVGSSFLHMTARDYARFGYLYLHGGEWNGMPLLPQDWAAFTASPSSAANGAAYGAHFWRAGRNADGLPAITLGANSQAFEALGEGGQIVLIVPEQSLVIVRLGNSPERAWPQINAMLKEIVESFVAPKPPANFLHQQTAN